MILPRRSSRRASATIRRNGRRPGFAFGRYEAVGSFSYGDTEKKTISGTTSFWILPWKPIALFLGSILAIVLLMYASIRMYIRRKLREMGISGNDRADMNFYAQKYQRSGSRLIVVTLVIFLFCVVFLFDTLLRVRLKLWAVRLHAGIITAQSGCSS